LCFSPDIVRVIKSREVRWAVHVACMGQIRNEYIFFIVKPVMKRILEIPRR
jgi:hypothetical protein